MLLSRISASPRPTGHAAQQVSSDPSTIKFNYFSKCFLCLSQPALDELRQDKTEDSIKNSYAYVTNQDREVVENTRSRVKKITKLANLKKLTRIEGYTIQQRSNPQRSRIISDELFKFDQIG